RPGAGLRHLAHRAAEVHVDDVGPGGLDHPGGLRHRPRLGAEDLDRQRVFVRAYPQVAQRLLVAVLDSRAGDHLRADEPGPEPASLAAKGLHADARHRCENDPRRELDVADPPGFPEIHLHGAHIVAGRLLTSIPAWSTIRARRRPGACRPFA